MVNSREFMSNKKKHETKRKPFMNGSTNTNGDR